MLPLFKNNKKIFVLTYVEKVQIEKILKDVNKRWQSLIFDH